MNLLTIGLHGELHINKIDSIILVSSMKFACPHLGYSPCKAHEIQKKIWFIKKCNGSN